MSSLTTTQGGNPMSILPNEKGGKMEAGKRVYIRYVHIWSDFDQEEVIDEFIIPSNDVAMEFYQEHFGTECHQVLAGTVVYIDAADGLLTMLDSQSILEIVEV
jgi:hypothetical protein